MLLGSSRAAHRMAPIPVTLSDDEGHFCCLEFFSNFRTCLEKYGTY